MKEMAEAGGGEVICQMLEKSRDLDTGKKAQVVLLGDTNLERPESQALALGETEQGEAVVLTGRLKKGCLTEQLSGRERPSAWLTPIIRAGETFWRWQRRMPFR